MANAIFHVPVPKNEPVLSYAPGSAERKALQAKIDELADQQVSIPMYIGSEVVFTSDKRAMHPPHNHSHVLGHHAWGDASHVHAAINAALAARSKWAAMPWEQRAAIFLKAADLLTGPYRAKMNAATMLGQSKN
jgi:1-pyrroline-5-carboxylate dehydrogenase